MQTSYVKKSVSLDAVTWQRIEDYAARAKSTPSKILRDAAELFLEHQGGRINNPTRLALAVEYCQLVLTHLLVSEAPEKAEEYRQLAQQRVSQHHVR